MEHSNTLISNYIAELYDANQLIEDSLLIGEQVAFINDAACMYNGLRQLVTPEYLTDAEFHWMKSVANSWNDITRAYNKSLQGHGMQDETMRDNMQDLQDAIDHLLDDLMEDNDFDPRG